MRTAINPMTRNKKDRRSRDAGAYRNTPWRFLPVVAVILLILVQSVHAAVQITSGTTHLSSSLAYGNTSYSIDYSYPSKAEVGKNLTVTIVLRVDSLTGLAEYLVNYKVVVNVFLGTQHLLSGFIQGGSVLGGANSTILYPGGRWGPNNITIPLTAENTGVSKGQSANGTLSITLQDNVWYGRPLNLYFNEPATQGQAGSIVIENQAESTTGQSTGQTYLPYALLASGAVLMTLAVVMRRGPQLAQGEQKR
jgi:hypothetical protein